MTRLAPWFLPLFALCALWGASSSPAAAQNSAAAPYQYLRIGARTDVHVHPHPGYALMGGGTDLDEAFRWLCNHADAGDFLALRASGPDASTPSIQPLCHLNSVATLIIPTRAATHDPFVAKTDRKSVV